MVVRSGSEEDDGNRAPFNLALFLFREVKLISHLELLLVYTLILLSTGNDDKIILFWQNGFFSEKDFMRLAHYLLATSKEAPKDTDLISHELMLRAGLIRKLASGIYTWLPLGWRVLRKVEEIMRQEMDAIGAQELLMPNVIPAELWQESYRWEKYGPELLRLQDRHERKFCFGPTHEEVITDICRREIKSYRQLPMNLYQIQIKFRDEIRPRFGVMRGREFVMKDAYSFHLNKESLQETYTAMYQAYLKFFKRLGLEVRAVEADSGAIGGSITHEFHVLASVGEDDIFYADTGTYAANVEQATSLPPQVQRPAASTALTLFDTPEAKTIKDLTEQFNIPATSSVKTMIGKNAQGKFFAFVLRGDHELNEIKAKKLSEMNDHFELATQEEIFNIFSAHAGSLGPVHCPLPIFVDRDAAVLADFVVGANRDGQHYKGVNWDRDIKNYQVCDLRKVVIGDRSPDGQGSLKHARGIEVGHIFQLGDRYSQAMNCVVLNETGASIPLQMGCYGIGITRVIAAAIEQHHDAKGILWPTEMAPFQVAIVPIQYQQNEQVKKISDELYQKLQQLHIEVVLDDRDERPGIKFADMDLIGIPHRIVISDKLLAEQKVEYKARNSAEVYNIPLSGIIEKLKACYG
jgi:prolyl-tRNA synthetase